MKFDQVVGKHNKYQYRKKLFKGKTQTRDNSTSSYDTRDLSLIYFRDKDQETSQTNAVDNVEIIRIVQYMTSS